MDIKEQIDMARPSIVYCEPQALLHNINRIKQCAPQQQIIAMVKANAYGCGIQNVVPVLEGHVSCFGVACLEEAIAIRRLGMRTPCVLLQGVFQPDEYAIAVGANSQCVIHHRLQLEWLLATPMAEKISIWIKVDTGMHRLGFDPVEVPEILAAIDGCAWVSKPIGLMTHFAAADELGGESQRAQCRQFERLDTAGVQLIRSLANSAAILSMPNAHADVVRPGIMLYGVSPFPGQNGRDLGLKPVMHFVSAVSAIHHYPARSPIGYGATWSSEQPAIIGVVPVGYADGYPRHIRANTPVWVNGIIAPIVGRVSMDMMTIDLTACPDVTVGTPVELWGTHIPVEVVAHAAETIGYELLTKVTARVRDAEYG
jgi:alanine racemase